MFTHSAIVWLYLSNGLLAPPLWMQGNLFRFKVRDHFRKQDYRKLVVDRVSGLPIF